MGSPMNEYHEFIDVMKRIDEDDNEDNNKVKDVKDVLGLKKEEAPRRSHRKLLKGKGLKKRHR